MKQLLNLLVDRFVNLSLTTKTLLIPALFSATLVVVTWVGLSQGESARQVATELSGKTLPRIASVNGLTIELSQLQIDLQRLSSAESNFFDQTAIAKIRSRLKADAQNLRVKCQAVLAGTSLDTKAAVYLDEVEIASHLLSTDLSTGTLATDDVSDTYAVLREQMAQHVHGVEQDALKSVMAALKDSQRARNTSLTVTTLLGAIALALAVMLGRLITQPLLSMTRVMQRLAQGDTQVTIEGRQRRDEIGGMACAVAVFQQNSMILEQAEKRLKVAQRMGKIGSWELDLLTNRLTWSDEIFRIFEIDPTQFAASYEAFLSAIHPQDRAAVNLAYKQSLETRSSYTIEHRLRFADGRIKYVREQCESSFSDTGQALRSVGTVQDITESKLAEKTTLELNLNFVTFLEKTTDFIYFKDQEGRFRFCSQTMADITGHASWRDMIGKHDLDVFPKETAQIYQEGEASIFRDGVPLLNKVDPFYDRSNNKGWFSTNKWPLFDRDGKVVGLFGISRDITAQKISQEVLQQSLNDKQALLMEVHHRVKNNLQVISSLLRLETRRSMHAETRSVLTDMQVRIMSMAVLHQLLYRSGTFASVDLGSYLIQLATQSFRTQSGSGDAVRLQLDVASVTVGMDQAIACGLLANELISNCMKHGFPFERSGEVKVSLQLADPQNSQVDPMWRLCVSDNGVGLPADFEARRKTSLGLQLAGDLSRQIDGSLAIESQPGEGAQFTVLFKVRLPEKLVMPM